MVFHKIQYWVLCFFLLYINDLPQAVKDCDVRLYADATCISYTHKTVKTIEDKLTSDFNTLCDWLVDNKLSIHFGEESILFSPKNLRKRAEPIVIKRHDVTLKQFPTVEYLGCLLDETIWSSDGFEGFEKNKLQT